MCLLDGRVDKRDLRRGWRWPAGCGYFRRQPCGGRGLGFVGLGGLSLGIRGGSATLAGGGLGLGTIGLLGSSSIGLGLGIMDLGTPTMPSGTDITNPGRDGGVPGKSGDPALGLGNTPGIIGGRPPDVPPDVKHPNKIRPPRWNEPGKTIPSAPGKAQPSGVRKALCGFSIIAGLTAGEVTREKFLQAGWWFPPTGGVLGAVLGCRPQRSSGS